MDAIRKHFISLFYNFSFKEVFRIFPAGMLSNSRDKKLIYSLSRIADQNSLINRAQDKSNGSRIS